MKRETKKFILQELNDYVYSCDELKKLYIQMEVAKKAPVGMYSNRQLDVLALRIASLERLIVAIETMSLMLTTDLLAVFNAKFVEKPQKSDREIYSALHISESKYYRDIHTLCEMLANRLGMR